MWNGTSGLSIGFSGSKLRLIMVSMMSPKIVFFTRVWGTCFSSSVNSVTGAYPFGGALPLAPFSS